MMLFEYAELEVVTKSGNTYRVPESAIVKNNLTTTNSCSSGGGIPAGSCNAGTLSVSFRAPAGLTYTNMFGAKIKLFVWHDKSVKTQVGEYNVTSTSKHGNIYTVSASDNIVLLDDSCYSAVDTQDAQNGLISILGGSMRDPATILELICNTYGVPHLNHNDLVEKVPDSGLAALATTVSPECSVESVKDFAVYIAEYIGAFITADADGKVFFCRLGDREPNVEINASNIAPGTYQKSPYHVVPVAWKVNFDSGYSNWWYRSSEVPENAAPLSIELSNNPFWQAQEDIIPADIYGGKTNAMEKYMWDYIVSAAYDSSGNALIQPFSATVLVPYLFRVGDLITIRDPETNTTFRTYITEVTWTFRGGQKISCAGEDTRTLSVSKSRSAAKKATDYSKYLYRKSKTSSGSGDSHTHANKSILDSISQTDIDNWNAADSVSVARHLTSGTKIATFTVSGTSYTVYAPSSPTAEQIAEWNAAAENAHAHTNKSVLDAITAAYTVAEKAKLAGLSNYVHPAHTAYESGLYKTTIDSLGHTTAATPVAKADITALGIPAQDTVYTHPAHTAYTSGLYKVTVDKLGHVTSAVTVTKSDITALGIPSENTDTQVQVNQVEPNDTNANDWNDFRPFVFDSALYPQKSGVGELYKTDIGYCASAHTLSLWELDEETGSKSIYQLKLPLRDGTLAVTGDIVRSNATTSTAGLMSAADKSKLDGVEDGANKTTVDAALSSTSTNPVQNKAVTAEFNKYLPLSGGTMTGTINSTAVNFLINTVNGYKTIFRSDGSNFYILVSDKDGGSFNDYRPLTLNFSTGVLKINGNAATATQVYSTLTNPTTATTYYLDFHATASSANKALRHNNGLHYTTLEGTASATGYGILKLGNGTAAGTAGNKRGSMFIYGTDAYYWALSGNRAAGANRTLYLPKSSGCLVCATDGSAVGSATTPVYINANGVATACTAVSVASTNYATLSISNNKISVTSACGMNTSGKSYAYNSSTYSGSASAEIHNDYTTNEAGADYAFVCGSDNHVFGNCGFAAGWKNTIAPGANQAAAIGESNTVKSSCGTAIGYCCEIQNNNALACGDHVLTAYKNSASFGTYNAYTYANHQITLGNGSSSARANAFRATTNGVYSVGAYNATGADYAEFFEWQDGNPDGEDRRGRFVTLDGEKIKIADSMDDDILGVVSGNASVIGDSYGDQWCGQYMTDIFGKMLEEEYTDEQGETAKRWVLNPDYDPNQVYVPRSERKEWAAVGMMGKLIVIDDGTCGPNGYCVPTTGGIATASEGRTGYRVLSRIDETHVRILVR